MSEPGAAGGLSEARRDELIESLARRVESMGLSAAVIFLLEAHKPLSFLGSQGILILQPLLSIAFDAERSSEYSQLLEERGSVERLIQRLEKGRDTSEQPTA
jgi:hypothetical protein